MKNIKKIKVVLPLILGLGGVVQGSSFSDSDLRSDVRVDFSSIATHPAQQMPVPEEEQNYLFGELGSKRFAFVDGVGNPIFFLTKLPLNLKYFVLAPRLFEKIVNKEVCDSMMATYGDSEIGCEIRDHINHEKSRLSVMGKKRPFTILMKNDRTENKSFVTVDSKSGKLYRFTPDGMDMKTVYCVRVSETLYKKLTSYTCSKEMKLDTYTVNRAACALGALGQCCFYGILYGLIAYFGMHYLGTH
ncbi:MAG: hypothetical protein LBJ71_01690 [Holosporaceae bacterium]|jgi:hypothetical protein|nr:hypothetical protein [Holosporaceae bacterium]